MNVLLINPPVRFTLRSNNAPFVKEHRGACPPLGLMYVAAYLREHTSHHVQIIDCSWAACPSTASANARTPATTIQVLRWAGLQCQAADVHIIMADPPSPFLGVQPEPTRSRQSSARIDAAALVAVVPVCAGYPFASLRHRPIVLRSGIHTTH